MEEDISMKFGRILHHSKRMMLVPLFYIEQLYFRQKFQKVYFIKHKNYYSFSKRPLVIRTTLINKNWVTDNPHCKDDANTLYCKNQVMFLTFIKMLD